MMRPSTFCLLEFGLEGVAYEIETSATATRHAQALREALADYVAHARRTVYYFATTAAFDKHNRLWRAEFKDAANSQLGGTIEKVLEGPTDPAAGPHMMDNITVNERGQVVILEDVGNNPYLGGVYQFDPASRALGRIAPHDPQRFLPGGRVRRGLGCPGADAGQRNGSPGRRSHRGAAGRCRRARAAPGLRW